MKPEGSEGDEQNHDVKVSSIIRGLWARAQSSSLRERAMLLEDSKRT